jgi:hypothetical protein
MDDDRFWTRARVVSALVVLAYMILAVVFRGGECAFRLFLFCMLPLMCIWFPQFMGRDYRGIGLTFPRVVTHPSPPCVVFLLAWVLLLLPAALVLLGCFQL